jgi:hypothetical protein
MIGAVGYPHKLTQGEEVSFVIVPTTGDRKGQQTIFEGHAQSADQLIGIWLHDPCQTTTINWPLQNEIQRTLVEWRMSDTRTFQPLNFSTWCVKF